MTKAQWHALTVALARHRHAHLCTPQTQQQHWDRFCKVLTAVEQSIGEPLGAERMRELETAADSWWARRPLRLNRIEVGDHRVILACSGGCK